MSINNASVLLMPYIIRDFIFLQAFTADAVKYAAVALQFKAVAGVKVFFYIVHKTAVKVNKPAADRAFYVYVFVAVFIGTDKLIYRDLRFVFNKFEYFAFCVQLVKITVDRGVTDRQTVFFKMCEYVCRADGALALVLKVF